MRDPSERRIMRGILKTVRRLWRRVLGLFGKGKPAMSLTDDWLALGHRLYEKGKAVFDHSSVLESEAGTGDPKVVALALLARTMGNFEAAVLLLDNDHIVEARAVTRCCFENF